MDQPIVPTTDGGSVAHLLQLLSTPLGEQQGRKLPWDDPAFSARMLREHLDETHDHASRRLATIDRHVDWIVGTLLGGRAGAIVDLGCGPGLYTERLAARGCRCVGVDISPASIAHARRVADARGLECTYVLGDVRTVDVGAGHDVELFLFGELNTFPRNDAAELLGRIARRLGPRGRIALEVHTFESLVAAGDLPRGWYRSDGGLFSDRPHVVLDEHVWDATSRTALARYVVLEESGTVIEHAETLYAYTHEEYRTLLTDAGFEAPRFSESMGAAPHPDMIVISAARAAGSV